jgi:hypothetical protein
MIQAPFYLSFGTPKSGSTLAFQLTKTMLEMAGIPQPRIANDAIKSVGGVNYVDRLDGSAYDDLHQAVGAQAHLIAIKTHSRLFPRIEKLLASGKLIGHAVCRDPRDMALSMLDAAREGRSWGGAGGVIYRSVSDTEDCLRRSVDLFTKWAQSPNIMPLHYERLAFDTESVAREIAMQLGITVDIPKAIQIATGRKFTQFNRGISERWKTQMEPSDAQRLGEIFKDFIKTYCSDVPAVPVAHKPQGRLLIRLLKRRLIKSVKRVRP